MDCASTAPARRSCPAAEQLESAALALERRRAAASPALSGTVRVSVGEWAARFLAGNLGRNSADAAAVRHHARNWSNRRRPPTWRGARPISRCVTIRPKAAISISPSSAPLPPPSIGAPEPNGDAWVTYTEEQAHYPTAQWVQQRLRATGCSIALRASNMPMQLAAIRGGAGQGILPCFVGDADPLLERVMPPAPEIAADYWVIVHRDLRRAACVRAVIDWIQALFSREARRAGRHSSPRRFGAERDKPRPAATE